MVPIPSRRQVHDGLSWHVAAVVLIAFLVAAVLRAGLEVVYTDRIYPGVRPLGLAVGGASVDQARHILESRLGAYAHQPLTIRAGDQTLHMTPADLGFQPHSAALVQASYEAGRTGSWLTRLAGPLMAHESTPSISSERDLDAATLDRAVNQIAAQINRPPRDATLIIGQDAVVHPERHGQTLDEAQVRMLLERYLAGMQTQDLELPVRIAAPTTTASQLDPIRARAASMLANAPVIRDHEHQWQIPVDVVRSSLIFSPESLSLTVDERAFASVVFQIATEVYRAPVDAQLVIDEGKTRIIPDQPGRAVDQPAMVAAIQAAVTTGQPAAPLVDREIIAGVTVSDLQPLAAELQQRIDHGIVLQPGSREFTLAGAELGDLIRLERHVTPVGTTNWHARLDEAGLRPILTRINEDFKYPSVSTRFAWRNGAVSFLGESRRGWVIDMDAAVRAVQAGWKTGEVELPVVESRTAMDDTYLARLSADLKGVVESNTMSFAGSSPERAHNVRLSAQKLNGVVVPPGHQFSFNRAIGPMTLDAGFTWGFAYATNADGVRTVVPEVAGGICQVASAVFQPLFWSGYQIDQRHAHMFWIGSYRSRGYTGLDATVYPEAGVDFKFTNNTDHALLIQAYTDEQMRIVVNIVGTEPGWQVQVDPERIYNITQPPEGEIRTESPLFAAGREIVLAMPQHGMTSEVTRRVIYPDGETKVLTLKSIYQPNQKAILIGTGGR